MNKKFRKAIQDSYVSLESNKKDAFFAEIENLSSSGHRDKRLPLFYRFAAGTAGLAAALCVGVYLKNMPAPPDITPPDDMIVSETGPAVTPTSSAVTEGSEKKTDRHTTVAPAETGTSGNTNTAAAVSQTSAAASQTQSGAVVSGTGCITAASPTAVDINNENGTWNTAPASDYEYEGSLIVKKYTAFLTSVLLFSNATAINTNAQEYRANTDYLLGVQTVKAFIEQNGESWLDINSDGKFDIFDVYAFYNIENCRGDCTVPDYIQEKYDSIPTIDINFTCATEAWKSGIEYMWSTYDVDETNHKLSYNDIMEYFLSCNTPHIEYSDPNYYIDNCPDEYNAVIPNDLIRRDDGEWDYYKYRESSIYIREEEGQIRRITKDDIVADENVLTLAELEKEKEILTSHIYRFIDYYNYSNHVTGTGSYIMKELVEKGIVDVDINSDGVFNFQDVALLAYASYNLWTASELSDDQFLRDIAFPESTTYHNVPDWMDFSDSPITRNGMEKAIRFFEVAPAYTYDFDKDMVEALAEYCVTSQETDPKFFDFDYYSDNNLEFCRRYPVLENLALYEELSIRFGPMTEEIELPERMNFTREEINEAFPEYYRKVKSGELPKPDINLDGKIDDADFNILFNLECEFSCPYKKGYFGTMVRRYPELLPVIGVSQEIRDNFETNFDFNNNGISADFLETECMLMYIYGELDKNYSDTQAFLDAQQAYFEENPDIQYYKVFNSNFYEFSRHHGKGSYGGLSAKEELDSIVAALAEFNMDMTAEEGTAAPAAAGDANLDTRVNIADAVAVLQYVTNNEKYPLTAQGRKNADIDGTAGITGTDALTIQKIDAGIISAE